MVKPLNARVGMYAMGRLMEEVAPSVNMHSPQSAAVVARRLASLRRRCAWTSGRWPTLNCAWNELQNTSQDKRRLAAFLVEAYRKTAP